MFTIVNNTKIRKETQIVYKQIFITIMFYKSLSFQCPVIFQRNFSALVPQKTIQEN